MWIELYAKKIPLAPVAMGRPRRGAHGMYTPPKSRQYLKKLLLDGIVSANLIPDDNQVTLIAPLPGATHMDLYAAHGEDPHTLLTISIWSTDAKTQPTHETITI